MFHFSSRGEDPACYPRSYTESSEKEKNILSCCENFQRQYSHLYPDRKPLFLAPKNECGIEVSICKSFYYQLIKFSKFPILLYFLHGSSLGRHLFGNGYCLFTPRLFFKTYYFKIMRTDKHVTWKKFNLFP